jgi:hypothetical protein
MADEHVVSIKELLAKCSPDERAALFKELRATHQIHQFEQVIGTPAEMILEAIHRAPELTRRMLRGVIADAAFAQFIVPALAPAWKDDTRPGNHSFDYALRDSQGVVTVQVKLQRSEKGSPVVKNGLRYGFADQVFMVEPQKTRGGTDGDDKETRPYRYGEFDLLAVSMQPSTGKWDRYMYTVGCWLIQGKNADEIAVMQPVSMTPNEFWTDDFVTAAAWLRGNYGEKRLKAGKSVRAKKKTPGPFDL